MPTTDPKSRGGEKDLFITGVVLLGIELILVAALALTNHPLVLKIAPVIAASLIGGRMASILTGLELGLQPVALILMLFFFNVMWLMVSFPLLLGLFKRALNWRFLRRAAQQLQKRASRRRERISPLGRLGLFVFVWLPLPWTGAVIGSLVCYSMGMGVPQSMGIVIPAMLVGIISWVYGFKGLIIVTGMAGKIVSFALLAVFLIYQYIPRQLEK
jgi:uncharacterized membrane protein